MQQGCDTCLRHPQTHTVDFPRRQRGLTVSQTVTALNTYNPRLRSCLRRHRMHLKDTKGAPLVASTMKAMADHKNLQGTSSFDFWSPAPQKPPSKGSQSINGIDGHTHRLAMPLTAIIFEEQLLAMTFIERCSRHWLPYSLSSMSLVAGRGTRKGPKMPSTSGKTLLGETGIGFEAPVMTTFSPLDTE